MGQSRLRLALYMVLVLMVVVVKVKGDPIQSPPGNFWCNCTEYNLAGSTSDYSEDCNAQCRPNMAAVEMSGTTEASTTGVGVLDITLYLPIALLSAVLPWLY